METLKDKQVLKKGLQDIVKQTKGLDKRVFGVRFNSGNYWIYNGVLLTTKVFNLKYAIQYCRVISSQLKKDEVYIVSEITKDQLTIFGL